MKPRYPIAPKAHGAWLGAGTGIGLAQVIVGVIQGITHKTLDPGIIAGIYAASGPLLAFIGAWVMPHQVRDPLPPEPRQPPAEVTPLATVTVRPQP